MIGNAGKKIQNIVDLAEELYEKVNQLREQIADLNETLDDTHDRVAEMESELAEQRALLEALADEEDVDVDSVLEELSDEEIEAEGKTDSEETTDVGDGAESPTDTATVDQN